MVYVLCLSSCVLLAGIYGLRRDGIFACQAAGYQSGRYLSLCDGESYGDYDHGAFWFGLEPVASAHAQDAEVLFLGNSRMQLALSTDVTSHWFANAAASYYLLGFSHSETVNFVAPLLRTLQPRAKVYVINLDRFFTTVVTDPARVVMNDGASRARYQQKREWQPLHRALCSRLHRLCRDAPAFFRSPETGAWVVAGGEARPAPATYDSAVNEELLQTFLANGRDFVSGLPVPEECVILTVVPTVGTPLKTGKAFADATGRTFVAPLLDGLTTFDQSHMDHPSAERWSQAFFEGAGPAIQKCLADASGVHPPVQ
jgi:hypothetical protein